MILIGLGANLPSSAGLPEATLKAALEALSSMEIRPGPVSRLYRTPAWPDESDPAFVNQVARVTTRLSPADLMAALHQVEMAFGRVRSKKNAPRTLDLDLLDYNGRIEPGPPELPHPRMPERSFVLIPLRDVAPLWRHPVSHRSLDDLVAALGREAGTPLPIG